MDDKRPDVIRRNDLLNNIINDINSANLPMFVVLYVLTDVTRTVSDLAKEEEKKANEEYSRALQQQVEAIEPEVVD